MAFPVVLDASVLIAALGSPHGASFQVLSAVGTGRFTLALSVPLVLEYEHVAKREAERLGITSDDVDAVVDFLCAHGRHQPIYFVWRPALPDPKDDMLLELAAPAHASHIVTHNLRDFRGCERFGVRAVTPRDFLTLLRAPSHEHDQPPPP